MSKITVVRENRETKIDADLLEEFEELGWAQWRPTPVDPELTVADIKAALDQAGVDYDAKARKDELLQLLEGVK